MYSRNSLQPTKEYSLLEYANHVLNVNKRARHFAHIVAMLWFYYGIGVWFGSRFIVSATIDTPDVLFIFMATLPVWFIAFFLYIGLYLIRKEIERR